MSAAAPTTNTAELPADLDERQQDLNPRTVTALKALALKAGVPVDADWKKPDLVAALAKSDDAMRAFGWDIPTTEASTGNVDANGDIIGGAAPADQFNCDDDGFPAESSDVAKLEDDHLDSLVFWLESNQGVVVPAFPGRDEKVAWIRAAAYEPEADTEPRDSSEDRTQHDQTDGAPDFEGDDAPAPHIPTAAPTPTTTTLPHNCACNGRGGYETDTGWEKCTNCDGAVEPDGQLTLVPGGDTPSKSILNIGAIRHDLGNASEFRDGDRVLVSFEITVDKIAFIPEKSGGESKRRVRTHAGAVDLETLTVSLA